MSLDRDASRLRDRLIEINERTTKLISIAPLQERREDELPLELLYASVVIREDPKYARKGLNSQQEARDVTDPADIFIKDGDVVRNVYMIGDAAHGKTTYCMWLLKKWCSAHQRSAMERQGADKWEKALHYFDYIFLVEFRYMNHNATSILDLICQGVFGRDKDFHAAIRYVLSSDKYKSLIIMDGMDEWNPSEEARKMLTCKGMPNIEGLSSSVSCFFSMRPWLLSLITRKIQVSDRVVEIFGLSETGVESVIANVLLNHYKLKKDSLNYINACRKIGRNLNESSTSFLQIPLVAVVCVQIWYGGKQVGDSMVSFYAAILNMLIERAYQKHELQLKHDKTVDCNLPKILSDRENIENCISTLIKLGKVAYESLLCNQTNLVFQKRKLEKEVGVRELQFALDVGLISQKDAPSLLKKNVSIHFFHRSVQEFLAVIYVVTQQKVSDSFCKYLSSVKIMIELSNITILLCGLCPSLGSLISKLAVFLTDNDTNICKFRESPDLVDKTVEELYKLQVSWYRELQYGQTDTQVTFIVSDIYLWSNSTTETVRVTKDFLSDHHVDIRSLLLHEVPADENYGITNEELSYYLSNMEKTRSLVKLYINGYTTDRSIHTLCIPTLRSLYLSHVNVQYTCSDQCSIMCPPLFTGMSELRLLKLCMLTLGDSALGLSTEMAHIEMINLHSVNMPAVGWGNFTLSLSNVKHGFDVELYDTNIDDESLTMIRSSPLFSVKQDVADRSGKHKLYFTRVWPLTHCQI